MDTVHCVFLSKGPGEPYDLQFIGSEKQKALDFATELMSVVPMDCERHWRRLTTGRHYFNTASGWVLRVSDVQVDVPRAQQPGDPAELREEIERMERTHGDAHGDSHAVE